MEATGDNLEEFNFSDPELAVEKLRLIYPKMIWEVASKDETSYVDDEVSDILLGLVTTDAVIFDLFSSECGRFEVDPEQQYGISLSVAKAVKKFNKF
jgi:hypothetical protein